MITPAPRSDSSPPPWAHQHDFEYQSKPRAGLNWPFAGAMLLDLAAWSSVMVSVIFWGCLIGAALH